jgi:toluene monooxygenase system protein A
MDYLTPLSSRRQSFKEFMQEWVLDQFLRALDQYGLQKPWYWETFLEALDYYHHMVYASAYTYRASVWFNLVVPGPAERTWLRQKYPRSWDELDPVWARISERWRKADPGNDFAVHGTAIVGFCELCQLVLCGGTPRRNSAVVDERDGQRRIFCSEPCRRIFAAPANLLALVQRYFELRYETWGKDAFQGRYPWLKRDVAAEAR